MGSDHQHVDGEAVTPAGVEVRDLADETSANTSDSDAADQQVAPLDKKAVVAVISPERTASQSVYHSLRKGLADSVIVAHSHLLGVTPWRQVHSDATQRKADKELSLLRRLKNPNRDRVVFSIWRDAEERICSIIWYAFADVLRDRNYRYASDPAIQELICTTLDKQFRYHALVYQRLGAVGPLRKGRNDLPNGVKLYILRFSVLKPDFKKATLDAFGKELSLYRINTAEERSGDDDGYLSFQRRFNLKDTLLTILKERYGIDRHMWMFDCEPGLLSLGEHWINVMTAAVTKETLDR